MVQTHFNGVLSTFEIVLEYFKGVNDGKEFFVVDLKVLFHRLMGLGMICNWVPTIEGIWLFKDCSCCKSLASVTNQNGLEWSGSARTGAVTNKGLNQGLEGSFLG